MDFLSWGLSQFIVQTVSHSAIIAIIVESMIGLWHIQKPAAQIKFRLLVLLPVIYLPFYFLLYPPRAATHFHGQVALIDSHEWLGLELWGNIAVWHLFAAMLVLATAYFLLWEAFPTIRYIFGRLSSLPTVEPGHFPELDQALTSLTEGGHFPRPQVLLSTEPVPVVHNLARKALAISAGTIDMLDEEELEAVIAHELAHLTGLDYRIVQLSLVLRSLMFYNPVALFIFRRIVADSEKDCDDISVSVTGKPLALASGLLRIFQRIATSAKPASSRKRRFIPPLSTLENQFHRQSIEERIERLVHPGKTGDLPYTNFRVLFTTALLLALLFFVV